MSLDATPICLTQFGTITISHQGRGKPARIEISGFAGIDCSCRDVAVLALLWAIGELQRDVLADVERAGAGRSVMG